MVSDNLNSGHFGYTHFNTSDPRSIIPSLEGLRPEDRLKGLQPEDIEVLKSLLLKQCFFQIDII